jgi:hypothetical protein
MRFSKLSSYPWLRQIMLESVLTKYQGNHKPKHNEKAANEKD